MRSGYVHMYKKAILLRMVSFMHLCNRKYALKSCDWVIFHFYHDVTPLVLFFLGGG